MTSEIKNFTSNFWWRTSNEVDETKKKYLVKQAVHSHKSVFPGVPVPGGIAGVPIPLTGR